MSICTGCKEPTKSNLECPKCVQLKLPKAVFCSQDCFRLNWSLHKSAHGDPNYLKRFSNFQYTGSLRAYPITPKRDVPDDIPKPDYWKDGIPISEEAVENSKKIPINTPEDIQNLRKCCYIARKALDLAHSMAKPGVTTDAIDAAVHDFIISHKAYPSPLNYYQFPKSCCTSVNEVICHGIPDLRPLESGDILNVDITVYYLGMHGDLNETFLVGEVDDSKKALIKATYESMMMAIAKCRPNMTYSKIGKYISKHVRSKKFSVVKTYTGHGVGKLFHCMPFIPHYEPNTAKGVMKPGHIFTIEPMINEGTFEDVTWPDNWTAVTADGKMSAQFEHTLLVTPKGVEILTARLSDSPPLGIDIKTEAEYLEEFKFVQN